MLVEITEKDGFVIGLEYAKRGYQNAISKCLVQKEVLKRLKKASEYLPDNITFKIYDAYRPFSLQEELYYAYKKELIKEFHLEDLEKEEQDKIINQYVALPDKKKVPAHLTGGAVDVTLVYKDSHEELDMGCCFDDFSTKTNTNAFDKKGMNRHIRDNRHMLLNAMEKAGFTNLDSEYWHYDYGNNNWATKTGNEAIYKNIVE